MIKDTGLWSEVEKLRGGLEDLIKTGMGYSGRAPGYRVHAKADEYVALVELPGIPKESVHVTFRDRQLLVTGTKPGPKPEEGEVVRDETWHGPFERALTLPGEVDGDRIQARFQDGVLMVRIPRSGTEKPRNVKID